MISVSFPVKPYVKKYLEVNYGAIYKNSSKSILTGILINVLKKDITKHEKQILEDYETYEINISENFILTNGMFLDRHRLFAFNTHVENLFREQIFSLMELNKEINKIAHQTTMKAVLKRYDITEEDIKFDSLYRVFMRYKKNKSIKN